MSLVEDLVRGLTDAVENFADRLCDRFPTRRERIATACLTGLLTDSEYDVTYAKAAEDAVQCADALIVALDK